MPRYYRFLYERYGLRYYQSLNLLSPHAICLDQQDKTLVLPTELVVRFDLGLLYIGGSPHPIVRNAEDWFGEWYTIVGAAPVSS